MLPSAAEQDRVRDLYMAYLAESASLSQTQADDTRLPKDAGSLDGDDDPQSDDNLQPELLESAAVVPYSPHAGYQTT